jgi:hypothetical protein
MFIEVPIVTYYSLFPGSIIYQAKNCVLPSPSAKNFTCSTIAGVGTEFWFTVTIGNQISDPYLSTIRYAAPSITAITSRSELDTQGGGLVTITGSNFGPAFKTNPSVVTATCGSQLFPGVFPTQSCSVISQTVVECVAGEGFGKENFWVVTIAGQSSDPKQVQSQNPDPADYADPVINSLIIPSSVPTEGGTEITLIGENFGPIYTDSSWSVLGTPRGYYGIATGDPFEYTTICQSYGHTQAICTTVQGQGHSFSWTIAIGGSVSVPSIATMSYDAPIITGIGSQPFPTTGLSGVLISGFNFGLTDPTTIDYVGIGPTGTEFTTVCTVTG